MYIMKKTIILALVAVMCIGTQAIANSKTIKAEVDTASIDSLYYCIGMAQSHGFKEHLATSMGVDTTNLDDFFKGFNEGIKASQDKKNHSYLIGLQIGQQVYSQMINGLNRELFGDDNTKYVGVDNFVAGFTAGVIGKNNSMTIDEASRYAQNNMMAIKAKQAEMNYSANKKAGEDFMAEIAKKEGVKQLENSGVYYEVITRGNGKVPANNSIVKVRYEGTLIDGTVFDNTMNSATPTSFRCDEVIPGWRMAITHMPIGSKWKVYIPQEMAYGEREAGDKIKPFSALVFVIELLSIDE